MDITSYFSKNKKYQSLLLVSPKEKLHIKGLSGSSISFYGGLAAINLNKNFIFIFPEKEDAAYFANDLEQLFPNFKTLFFPSSYKHPGQSTIIDSYNVVLRAKVLSELNTNYDRKHIIITYADAVAEKVIDEIGLKRNSLKIQKGENVDIEFVKETLVEYGFVRNDFVYEPGQFAVRGSIIDVFSFATKYPVRIDFFGNEIESIRSFDIDTQLSIDQLDYINIVPDLHKIEPENTKVTLFNYFKEDTILWFINYAFVKDKLKQLKEKPWYRYTNDDIEDIHYPPDLIDEFVIEDFIKNFSVVDCASYSEITNINKTIEFKISPQPVFNKNFDLLANHFKENKENGYTNIICSENPKQIERLQDILNNIDKNITFEGLIIGIHEGFVDHDLKYVVYTDHQIFERYHRYKVDIQVKRNKTQVLSEIIDLHPGDYVVHIDHGIGIFGGIEKVEINGKMQEVIKLVFKDNDILYVGIHSLHRISKYKSSGEGEQPSVSKLGSGAWNRLKQATKKKVKDIARELIALYAKRKETQGFAFSPDNYLQEELEASFIYEDTPDQEKATKIVKQGMESNYPMDMLICGDVGFGKTEVAIRAAFKAALDNKQTAVLVPTTILALQHYKTFSERLRNFPVTVEYISRTRKTSVIKDILKSTADGKVDILIGTHKILGKDVKFKDLGLLIIDEEQKFGVAMKEKLRALKLNIDTISLSATPIPRTLQFSLMGARDLAIINTPPPNRYPIITEVHTFNEEIIKEGINYELSRGGQVFFINNRIQNLIDLKNTIQRIVPDARIAVAHGQMEGNKMEETILDFISGEYDVLVCTAIIESGIDISNVNTIFIMDAHRFGLSDLHQLRGRVGRTNKKAFCYLLVPPFNTLTPEARRRLKAIEQHSDLGSGFNIAMLDLDIRGAGNLLGAEQSGFISEIGYETYQRILNEAILELKEEEFKDVFYDNNKSNASSGTNAVGKISFVSDCQIDTDMEILIPESYVENISERIRLYRELDNIDNENELIKFEQNIADRFGPIPDEVNQLIDVVRLRFMALILGFERISIKNERLTAYFIQNQNSPYYQSDAFNMILQFVKDNPRIFKFKQSNEKLTMFVDGIKNIRQAIALFQKILDIIK